MRRTVPRVLLAAALLVAALLSAPPGASAKGCAGARVEPAPGNLAEVRKATLCLLNRERAKAGLSAIRGDRRLRKAAVRHSKDMVRRRYFAHVSPQGGTLQTRAAAVRYIVARASFYLAENIAWGSGPRARPAEIVRSWMDSPPHRANVLSSRVKDAGVGIAIGSPQGGRGATYTLGLGRVAGH